MGKVISVTSFTEMENSARKLEQLSEEYTKLYNCLLEEARTMGAAWEGADNLAFVTRIEGFTEEFAQMAQKLRTAGQTLRKQKENYAAQQESNITAVNKLMN
ncbi:MAG: WXG100 family type VII secretion target [Oscillospiraceae bacterium]|nr:WXG100 family type VII secretion target [Oscillospiraceae bacterium]